MDINLGKGLWNKSVAIQVSYSAIKRILSGFLRLAIAQAASNMLERSRHVQSFSKVVGTPWF